MSGIQKNLKHLWMPAYAGKTIDSEIKTIDSEMMRVKRLFI